MSVKKNTIKKNTNTTNKKYKRIIFSRIFYKSIRISRIILYFVSFISIILFSIYFYKEDVFVKLKNSFSLQISNLLYKNICDNVEINGVDRADINKIQWCVDKFCALENKNDMTDLMLDLKTGIWINNVYIKREIPNTLKINIEEYIPFAVLNHFNNIDLLDANGEIIPIADNEKRKYLNMLTIVGDGSLEHINGLFNMLSTNQSLFNRIKRVIRIGNRRWNLVLDNGIIVQLPEHNMIDAWNNLDKILSIDGVEINVKIIDMRNKDKIFIEEK